MKALFRAIGADAPLFFFLSTIATIVLGLGLNIATASPRPQGETAGTLPVIVKATPMLELGETVSIEGPRFVLLLVPSDGSASQSGAIAVDQPAVYHTSWRSRGQEHKVDVPQGVGEDDAHWAARCASKVNQLQHVFPPDPPSGG